MTEITRTVQQLVADIDVDDDGLVTIHAPHPLTPDEARDAAAAIIVAAKAGEEYATEQAAREQQAASLTRCALCSRVVEPDEHSTSGWRHVSPRPQGSGSMSPASPRWPSDAYRRPHRDDFPHGTPDGHRAGCRTSACPAALPCRDVYRRYAGDYSFPSSLRRRRAPR